MTLSAGSKLGPYEILGQIGAGGMGEVYRARDPRLGREVAIKLLPAELSRDPERMKRFEREARAASALTHPHIVTIHDVMETGSGLAIVMELISGRTLRELLAEGALPARQWLSIAAQAADGGRFESGTPVPLFRVATQGNSSYDVSADGERSLVSEGRAIDDRPVTVIARWAPQKAPR